MSDQPQTQASQTPEEPSPQVRKRFKWEPLVAILSLVIVSALIVYDPGQAKGEPVRVANSRGVIATETDTASGQRVYRIVFRDGFKSAPMSAATLEQTFGPRVLEAVTAPSPNWVFRICNVTGWGSFAWVVLGFAGQAAFSGRMLIQWFLSEKHRKSVVPASFWWLSLFGASAMFAYFVWRQDVVGIMGQAPGLVIYARNLRLIAKSRRRAAAGTN